MICGIVQQYRVSGYLIFTSERSNANQEFVVNGCPNCESLINFKSDDGLVQDCTSPSFEGLIAVCDATNSWAAKWLRVDGFQTGLYAVKVNGRLPEDIVQELASKGVEYRPRDGSAQD